MTVDDLCAVLDSRKRLIGPLDWILLNQTRRVAAALEISGVVAPGVGFRMTCYPDLPDEKVAVILLAEIKRKPRPFARIDWRGQAHENRHSAAGSFLYTDAGRTHFHDPNLHHGFSIDELFGAKLDLPVARKIEPEPANYEELLAASSDLLHIENLKDIPVPPWSPQASLF